MDPTLPLYKWRLAGRLNEWSIGRLVDLTRVNFLPVDSGGLFFLAQTGLEDS